MRRRLFLVGGLVAAAVVVAVVGVWWAFFSDDAPDAVDITAANEQLDRDLAESSEPTATTSTDPVETPTTSGSDARIARVWTVDNTIGEFEFDSASGSFAGFRVEEDLTIGSATAVGRTDAVSGTVTVADGSLVAAEVSVDLTGIVSNESRREDAIQRALETTEFPEATFVLTRPVALPDGLFVGEPVEVDATGDLTIHGVTNTTTFSLTANVRDDGIAVVAGAAPVVFADYGVETPSAPIVVSVEDNGIVELQLLLT